MLKRRPGGKSDHPDDGRVRPDRDRANAPTRRIERDETQSDDETSETPRALQETQDLTMSSSSSIDMDETVEIVRGDSARLPPARPRPTIEPARGAPPPMKTTQPPPTPLPRRPSVKGHTVSQDSEEEIRREVASRVRPAPRTAAPPNDRVRLQRLLDINKAINAELELGRLLDMIMDAAIGLSNARRGFLVLWDRGEARVVRARNFEKMAIDSPEAAISRHLVREAIDRRESVVTAEAAVERGGYASTTGLDLKSVLVSPLLSRGRILGAIYLDEPDRVGVFTPEDVRTVEAFCDQAAIALLNARALEELTERVESQRIRLKRAEDLVRKKDVEDVRRFGNIVARSAAMRKVFELLQRVAETSFPVVIQGESGTGKELVAKAIHYVGPRKDGPFIATNCAAVPETLLDSELFGYMAGAFTGAIRDRKGLFEQADKGTLFLDEIEEMSPSMQGKLLRVLQEGEIRRVGAKQTRRVDVRVLAATNRDIRAMVEKGEFRRDLYYRLNVIPVTLPPLRDRREDIPLIVEDLLTRLDEAQGPKLTIDPDALAALQRYRWPGNVRELENELKRILALGARHIRTEELARPILHPSGEDAVGAPPATAAPLNLRDLERIAIERALETANGNKTQAAKLLGLSRRGLLKKLDRWKVGSSGGSGSDMSESSEVEDE